jgi:hydroxymethylpyrimidine/phosphomethylpyrimidine kinase
VKGGHLESIAADVLYDGRDLTEFRAERINTKNTTGAVVSSPQPLRPVWPTRKRFKKA